MTPTPLPAPWRVVESSPFHLVMQAPARHPLRHSAVELCIFDDGVAQVRNPESSYVMKFPDVARALEYTVPLIENGVETRFARWDGGLGELGGLGWRAKREDSLSGWGPMADTETAAIIAVLKQEMEA